jgi:hypothetical protein
MRDEKNSYTKNVSYSSFLFISESPCIARHSIHWLSTKYFIVIIDNTIRNKFSQIAEGETSRDLISILIIIIHVQLKFFFINYSFLYLFIIFYFTIQRFVSLSEH